jgi:hypothetical protein
MCNKKSDNCYITNPRKFLLNKRNLPTYLFNVCSVNVVSTYIVYLISV